MLKENIFKNFKLVIGIGTLLIIFSMILSLLWVFNSKKNTIDSINNNPTINVPINDTTLISNPNKDSVLKNQSKFNYELKKEYKIDLLKSVSFGNQSISIEKEPSKNPRGIFILTCIFLGIGVVIVWKALNFNEAQFKELIKLEQEKNKNETESSNKTIKSKKKLEKIKLTNAHKEHKLDLIFEHLNNDKITNSQKIENLNSIKDCLNCEEKDSSDDSQLGNTENGQAETVENDQAETTATQEEGN